MQVQDINQSLEKYHDVFEKFTKAFRLPKQLFQTPDHAAIKCANEFDYLETCTAMSKHFTRDGLWEVSMDGRKLATGALAGRISIGSLLFGWVEIMEPRPGKELAEGFIEHTEFAVSDLFAVVRLLAVHGVPDVEHQQNSGHAWINVTMDDTGREIKFNNKSLDLVVAEERAQGLGRMIHP